MAAILCQQQALELYKVEKACLPQWLNLQRAYCQVFFTMIIAIMAASLGGLWHLKQDISSDQIDNTAWYLLVLFGPIVCILLCVVGYLQSDRKFKIYLESVALLAKLEHLIGLRTPRDKGMERPFVLDDQFMPERWKVAQKDHASAETFVNEQMGRGANRVLRYVFYLLGASNVAFVIWIICLVFRCT